MGHRNLMCSLFVLLAVVAPASTASGQPAGEVLVISRDAAGALTTTWLRGPDAEIVAGRPGALMAAGGTLWSLEPVVVGVELCNCHLGPGEIGCHGTVSSRVSMVKLASVDGTTLIEPSDVRALFEETTELDSGTTLLAVTGTLVFVDSATWAMGCGAAHGYAGYSFAVYDLAARAEVELYDVEERAALEATLGPVAIARLVEAGWLPFDETARLTRLVPAYDAEGALRVELQLTVPTDYASSDDAWDSYTISALLEAPSLPAALAPYSDLPAAARAFRDAHPELVFVGWTAFDADPAVAEEQARAFAPAAAP
jgi:hypothetical protein